VPDFDNAALTAVPRPAPVVAPAAPPSAPTRPDPAPGTSRTAPAQRVQSISRSTRPALAPPSTPAAAPAPSAGTGSGVLALAARYLGVPYVWGGTTPRGFDCSGYVQYVFAQAGVRLPRTADQQMHAGRQIPRSQARPGDLVAFVSGGQAYHIGIYAGGNMMYDAPHTGSTVERRTIWSGAVAFVRV
ncbi:MAG TPA: NlpC/P60 family protein, partial [Kineosporiaceae bacterium]|nr:NlpC/P60 family protein [Kineosporiaceae bacterium]